MWIPSYPFLDRGILSLTAITTSSASRNCSSQPLWNIHSVIFFMSPGLFIIDSNVLSLACSRTSPLPLAHWGQGRTMCFTFCDGYPNRHFGFSTAGIFLLYRWVEANILTSHPYCNTALGLLSNVPGLPTPDEKDSLVSRESFRALSHSCSFLPCWV